MTQIRHRNGIFLNCVRDGQEICIVCIGAMYVLHSGYSTFCNDCKNGTFNNVKKKWNLMPWSSQHCNCELYVVA